MRRVLAFTVVALSFVVVDATAQATFQWSGQLTSGQTIEIKGINGDVRATPSSSGQVEVTATKSARRSNPADVRIDVVCPIHPLEDFLQISIDVAHDNIYLGHRQTQL